MILKILVTLATLGLMLPWFNTNQAGFTVGVHDFAEWLSLHPLERSAGFPMPTTLLLRLQVSLVILMWLTAIREIPRPWWLLMLALCCVAQLPPINALVEWQRDPNYLQQILISSGTFLAALLALRIHAQALILLAGGAFALASTTAALITAQERVASFSLIAYPMTGTWLYLAAMISLALYTGTRILRAKQTG